MAAKYYVVLITCPVGKGEQIASFIVEKKLGACVNRVEKVSSLYRWQGKIEKDQEELLIVKTSAQKFKELLKGVKGIHPYSVPEIIALPIAEGLDEYLNWIDDSLKE